MRTRPTARLVILDEQNNVLLFFTHWNRRVAPPRWLTPGGGVDEGETAAEGAVRELFEETGQVVSSLGEPILRRQLALPAGHAFDAVDATYFLLRLPRFEPDRTHWEPNEHDDILDIRWWSLDELRATHDNLDDENIVAILEGLTP